MAETSTHRDLAMAQHDAQAGQQAAAKAGQGVKAERERAAAITRQHALREVRSVLGRTEMAQLIRVTARATCSSCSAPPD